MLSGRKLFHALLGASLIATVLAVATTAQADTPLSGNKPCSSVAPQAGATKVLLAGDSIVHQSRGDYTWRYFLDKQLRAANVNFDFVGDYNWVVDGNRGNWPFCDYQDTNFDTEFTASPGTELADFNVVGQTPGGIPWIRYEVQNWQADVVVMLAGANDLAKGATAAGTLTEAQNVVANARAANPNVKIVLVATPTGGPYDNKPNAAYNTLLKNNAPGWSTPNSPVAVTDPMTGWGTSVRTWDDIHPNVIGEQLIAGGIADALHSLSIGNAGLPVDPAYKVGLRNPATNLVASLDGTELGLSWTLPVGASGVQIVARDTTSGTTGPWFLVKDMNWRPLDSSVGCPNPTYNPNPFSPTYDPNQTLPCTATTLTSGLSGGHTYDIALHAEKGTAVAVDLFSNLQSVSIPGDFVPAAPSISTATAGIHQVTVAWPAVPGAETYKVAWRIGTGAWTFSSASSATSRLVKPLNAGVKYDFRVQAITGTKASAWSASKFATPKAYVMSTPAKPVLKQLAGQKVRVTWKVCTGANRYLLQFHQVGGAWRNIAFYTGTTYTSGKLAKKKAYEWRVVAYDGVVAGKTSLAARITVK